MSAPPRSVGAWARVRWPGTVGGSVIAAGALCVGAWSYLLIDERDAVADLFAWSTVEDGWHFVAELLGLRHAPPTPAFLSDDRWGEVLALAYDTVVMSVLAIALATVGMLLTVVLAVRPREDATASPLRGAVRRALFLLVRASYVVSRAVPELVWALIIIIVVRPGVLAGALALAIHNVGIVGRLTAEVVEDLDPAPARALRSAGASGPQVLLYGVLPQALPQVLTYVLYRWEVIMRTTIVVGFVAAGGLGREFRLSMSFFQFTDVALILLVYFLLVVVGEAASARLRRLAR